MERERVQVMTKRAEIDTTAPFRSVKEAVTLFGERVLAGELYNTTNLKEMNGENGNGHGPSRLGNVAAELEETKQSLQKAREESELMATSLSSLKQELERTKKELRVLKDRESEKPQIESEIEDVKFVEGSRRFEIRTQSLLSGDDINQEAGSFEFQKKRYVTFANPPSLAKVMIPQGVEILERHPSLKKKKKKPLIPLIGGIFSKKKASPEVA